MTTAIVFSSQTGNTEMMAEQIKAGAEAAGKEVLYCDLSEGVDESAVLAADLIILCPGNGQVESARTSLAYGVASRTRLTSQSCISHRIHPLGISKPSRFFPVGMPVS